MQTTIKDPSKITPQTFADLEQRNNQERSRKRTEDKLANKPPIVDQSEGFDAINIEESSLDKIKASDQYSAQTLSVGGARYGYKKCEAFLREVEDCFLTNLNPEICPSETVLERKIWQLLRDLKDSVGEGEENRKILRGFLNILSTLLSLEKFPRFDLVRKIVEKFELQELKLQLKPTVSKKERHIEYINRQSRLFQEAFSKLYETHADKYILFHEGDVLFSGETIDEVAKNAYSVRGSKDIFIKKVALKGDNHEILTPLTQDSSIKSG